MIGFGFGAREGRRQDESGGAERPEQRRWRLTDTSSAPQTSAPSITPHFSSTLDSAVTAAAAATAASEFRTTVASSSANTSCEIQGSGWASLSP